MKNFAFGRLSLFGFFCIVSAGSYSNECINATSKKITNPLLILIGFTQVDSQEQTCQEQLFHRIEIDENYFSTRAEDPTFRKSMSNVVYQADRRITHADLTDITHADLSGKASQTQNKSEFFIETLKGYNTLN